MLCKDPIGYLCYLLAAFVLFEYAEDPRLTRAIADLDERARNYIADHLGSSEGNHRRLHHERVEENAPSERSKRGKTVLLESHRLHRRHKSGQYEHDSHRAGRLPQRRESASRSGQQYSNRSSDKYSEGCGSVREFPMKRPVSRTWLC